MSPSAAVDVSPQAQAEGFTNPTVVMRSVWERFVEAPDDAEEAERLTGLLQSAMFAVHAAILRPDDRDERLRFAVRFGPLAGKGEPIELDLLLCEPVLVISLPDEA